MDELTRWLIFVALLYCIYAYALKPQLWHVFQIGWKRLSRRFAASPPLRFSAPSLIRVGWNQYQAVVQVAETGVYLQRQSNTGPDSCLFIPYVAFKVGKPGPAFQLLTADAYSFFTVQGVAVWVKKEYGSIILMRSSA